MVVKILTPEQCRQADAYTIANEPVKSIDLMERAAKACVDWLTPLLKERGGLRGAKAGVRLFCGPGNNGGDGLAIARLLKAKKVKVEVYALPSDKYAADFNTNEKRLKKAKVKVQRLDAKTIPAIGASDLVIDALFGTGLNKPLEGLAATVVERINGSGAIVISIDLPSGNKVRATHTLTFQSPKLEFMFPGYAPYVGNFTVLDIGLDQDFIAKLPVNDHYVTGVKDLLKPRAKFSHKGSYGHALLVSGSYGKMGAAVLAAKACLRSGAGLLTVHVPKSGYEVLQTALPEAMVSIDAEERFIGNAPKLEKYSALGIGPGIGTEKQTQNVLKLLIQNARTPLVLDADALNILGENRTWLSFLPSGSILTPHPREFERLTEKASGDEERYQLQKEFSVKHGVYTVLKGAHTAISTPEGKFYFNSTGNPGMAKGGSGDVLTGMLTGFLAQGYTPLEACLLGVYLHGLAGDMAAEQLGEHAVLARDIIEAIPEAFKRA